MVMHLAQRGSAWLVLVAAFALADDPLLVAPARADSGCKGVRAELILDAPPLGPFAGQASLRIGSEVLNADVAVTGTGAKVTEDGTVVGSTSITYDFGSGNTFRTGENHFALSPTETPGVFNLSDQGRITEGTGIFLNSFGKLVLHGTVSFSASGAGEAILDVKGRLCDIAQ
jgi:hypothetical protein